MMSTSCLYLFNWTNFKKLSVPYKHPDIDHKLYGIILTGNNNDKEFVCLVGNLIDHIRAEISGRKKDFSVLQRAVDKYYMYVPWSMDFEISND